MPKEYYDLALIVPLEEELQQVLATFPLVEDRSTATQFRCIASSEHQLSAFSLCSKKEWARLTLLLLLFAPYQISILDL
jgi:hypothetical protein